MKRKLVWLGAGNALSPYYDFELYEEVTLVEAREDACHTLQKAFKEPQVTIINTIIHVEKENSDFNVYSVPEFSSISQLANLKQWFPSIELIKKTNLRSTTILELINDLSLEDNRTINELVVDTPDIAFDLILKLSHVGLIYKFNSITILYPVESIYENMQNADSLCSLLERYDFDLCNNGKIHADTRIFGFVHNSYRKLSRMLEGALRSCREEMECIPEMTLEMTRTYEKALVEKKVYAEKLANKLSNLEKKIISLEEDKNKLLKQIKEQGNSLDSFIHQCNMFFYGKAISYVDVGAFDGKVARSFFESNIRIDNAILIEPNPKSFEALKATLKGSRKLPKKLNTLNVGVSSHKEPLRLYDNNSMSRIIPEDAKELPVSSFEIRTMTLDNISSFCGEGEISLLKIDVEGHELQVLDSGKTLFANQMVDIIYIEAGLNPEGKQQVHYRLLDDFFLKYNYKLFRVFEQQYEWLEGSPFLRRWNMAYMSKKFADKHPYKIVKELFELKRSKI
jgi:FkbM family methyltransferase